MKGIRASAKKAYLYTNHDYRDLTYMRSRSQTTSEDETKSKGQFWHRSQAYKLGTRIDQSGDETTCS